MTNLESTIVNFVRTLPDQDLIRLIHGHVSRALARQSATREPKNRLPNLMTVWPNLKFIATPQRPQKAPKKPFLSPLPTPMAKVHSVVKSYPGLTSRGISRLAKVPDTTVRDYLKVLGQKGLVSRSPQGRRITYKSS